MKVNYERQTIAKSEYIDSNLLFDQIDEVVKYLNLLKGKHSDKNNLFITDVWTGYDDVHYELTWSDMV